MTGSSRRKQIEECAAKLFRKRGFNATSMRDIAAELNIEAPSLYNHISGKQDILKSILLELATEFTSGMDRISISSLQARKKLEHVIKLHVDLTLSHTNGMALITSDWIHLEEPAFSQFVKMRDDYEIQLREILKESLAEESIQNVNIDLALFSILSTLRWLYSWYLKHTEVNKVELEHQMIRNLLNGIFKTS